MSKRHADAIAVNLGAVNPSAIALAIVAACKEIRAEPDHTGTAQITSDPAVRLMVFQLAYICQAEQIECGEYTRLVDACEAVCKVAPLPSTVAETHPELT